MTTITTLEPVSMISYVITHNNNNSNKDTKYWPEEQEFVKLHDSQDP
jgi:hypothetical protein